MRRSKPQVNRFGLLETSSSQAVLATIRLCPWRLERGSLASLWPVKSNRRTCRLSNGIAMIPFDETDRRLTAESALMVAKGDRMFRRSQTLTVRSSEPETTLSSFVNTAEVTLLKRKEIKHI